jgi:biotin carboxyl carrier protein
VKYYVTVNGEDHEVDVTERMGELRVTVDGAPTEVSYEEVDRLGQVAMVMDGRSYAVSIEGDENDVSVSVAGRFFKVLVEDERERAAHAAERETARKGGVVKSVMPGIVIKLLVAEGDTVEQGEPLLILEAMKMQNEIAAPATAVVRAVHVAEGQAVGGGETLVTLGD